MKKTTSDFLKIVIAGAILSIFLLLIVSMFSTMLQSDCEKIDGIVYKIGEGGVQDLTLQLEGKSTEFYINRGLEKYSLEQLQSKLLRKNVTIYFVEHSFITLLLSSGRSSEQIRKLNIGAETFYSEL